MVKRMDKFNVVYAKTRSELEKKVNESVKENWEPLGAPFVYGDRICHIITQNRKDCWS